MSSLTNDILNNEELVQLENLISVYSENKQTELEVSFFNVNYPEYVRILEKYISETPEDQINCYRRLDINILLTNKRNYRISVTDDTIESVLSRLLTVQFSDQIRYLISLDPSNQIDIVYKDRSEAQKLFINDYSVLFKVTPEILLSKKDPKPNITDCQSITYRYKDLCEFKINSQFRIDISSVQQSRSVKGLESQLPTYEIELEVIDKKINTKILLKNFIQMLKNVQNKSIPLRKSESQSVIERYRYLLETAKSQHLEARNVLSIEQQHIIKFIPNKYGVTEKADGERYFLCVFNSQVYLISMNLEVIKLNNHILKDSNLSDIIIDGEYIINGNRKIFMAFDVVYFDGQNMIKMTNYHLQQRLDMLKTIIDTYFGNLVPFTDYLEKNSNMESNKIRSFLEAEIKKYWKRFGKMLSESKQEVFVTRKLYLIPYGIGAHEVFMYANILWKNLVYGGLSPYQLDGIIYTPLKSPYMVKVDPSSYDSVPLEYKWKSPAHNSIDFYVIFEKDGNGSDAIFYDTTTVNGIGKSYKIAGLYVGVFKGSKEVPVPFKVGDTIQKAYLYVTNDEARDISGNIIADKTVVEFTYDITGEGTEDGYKWIAQRTRYDKTESVLKYGRKYGNNLIIAKRIWVTIAKPITEDHIAALADPNRFPIEIKNLEKQVPIRDPSFVYYQKHTNGAKGMRAFNNWIKSTMINSYCKNKTSVLDIGCGRAGDIYKFIEANVKEYVGLDVDYNGLYVINGNANQRYQYYQKKSKNPISATFIQADAKAIFSTEKQKLVIPNMKTENLELIKTFLSNKKYDAINCQFNIHYYLSDSLSWSNFCDNINRTLDSGGHLLITCFDGETIHKMLKDRESYAASYTDNEGNKNIFFEIKKEYTDDHSPIGMGIDFYNSLISNPGVYHREYLVFPQFLIESLAERCDLSLIETDTFYHMFNIHKNFFTKDFDDQNIMSDLNTSKYKQIQQFYSSLNYDPHQAVETSLALASFKLSILNRYYVFQKRKNINPVPPKLVSVNKNLELGNIVSSYLHKNKIMIEPSHRTTKINNLYSAIRKKYPAVKPSVYLIRHQITENKLDDTIIRNNSLDYTKLKEGSGKPFFLIYKSPEKSFYPVYQEELNEYGSLLDNDIDDPKLLLPQMKKNYLFRSQRISDELDQMVQLSKNK